MILYGQTTYGKPEKDAVMRVLESGWLSGGKETAAFEQELAKWWGVKYAVSTNSGSTANLIALQSLNMARGAEVITPALAFPTTVAPIYYLGMKPVYTDIESFVTYTISIEDVKTALKFTKARIIMFAHTLGNMCDMDALMALAKQYKAYVIEDCCDAMGSKWNGKKAGTFGNLATVSFYPAHHMTTGGEGGAVLTNDEELYWRCKSIRDWGRDCRCGLSAESYCGNRFYVPGFDHRYYYTNLGLNFKMSEMQAAFGREQLKRIDGFIAKRKANFKYLWLKLREDVSLALHLPDWGRIHKPRHKPKSGETSKPAFYPPVKSKSWDDISWFAFPLCLGKEKAYFIKALEEKGIQARALFCGDITKHPAYAKLPHSKISNLIATKTANDEAFFVGIAPKITKKELDYMAKTIRGLK